MATALGRSISALVTAGALVAGTAVGLAPAGAQPASSAVEGGTAFGAVVKPQGAQSYPQALAQSESRYGRLGVVRFFARNGPGTWADYEARWGDRTPIISFGISPSVVLSGSKDQALRQFFAAAPRDHPVYWTFFHEPENDIEHGAFTAARFREAFAHVADLAAAANNPQLQATLILMCYTVNPNSGRDWHNYYVEGSVQVLGWDCYNHKWRSGGYGTPENLLSRAVATSQSTGLPWGVAELGSVRGFKDPTGSGRAAWLRACGSYLSNQGAAFVSYFDTNGAGTDYRLLDEPSRAAWDELVTDPAP